MRRRDLHWQKAALWLGLTWAIVQALRGAEAGHEGPVDPEVPPGPDPAADEPRRERGAASPRVLASVLAGVVLFASGAALGGALSASAEDGTPPAAIESGTATTATDETTSSAVTTTDAVTSDETVTSPAPAPTTVGSDQPPASTSTGGVGNPAPAPGSPPVPGSDNGPPGTPPPSGHAGGSASGPVLAHHSSSSRPPETSEGGAATIWLHRFLPDPTPPARRLSPEFASLLRTTARAHNVRWSLVLAVLRARGRDGRVPAGAHILGALARRIAAHEVRLTAQIRSLSHYDRAVGLHALVTGLEAAKPRLERKILADSRIEVYPAGRSDIASGRVDVRVLVVVRYLVVTYRQVSVSSLITGHRLYARPRVVSAHVDGLAVDISAVGGSPITGHQDPGGVTEHCIEALLRLPSELQPQQIISLLGLGGASFPQADHHDHVHIGF